MSILADFAWFIEKIGSFFVGLKARKVILSVRSGMKNNRFAFFVGALCVLGVSWYVVSMEGIPHEVRLARKKKYIQEKRAELEQANQKLVRLQNNLKEKLTPELSLLIQRSKKAQDEKNRLQADQSIPAEEKRQNLEEIESTIELLTEKLKENEQGIMQIDMLRTEIAQQKEIVHELEKLIGPQPEQQVPEQPERIEAAVERAALFKFTRGQKIGAGIATVLTAATLTAAVKTYLNWRGYTKRKQALIKKYKLKKLTPLQNRVWMAIALASTSFKISRSLGRLLLDFFKSLQYLVTDGSMPLTSFVGSDPQALAELYYGFEPTENQVREFITTYFGGVQ